jgi:hypothetical protein
VVFTLEASGVQKIRERATAGDPIFVQLEVGRGICRDFAELVTRVREPQPATPSSCRSRLGRGVLRGFLPSFAKSQKEFCRAVSPMIPERRSQGKSPSVVGFLTESCLSMLSLARPLPACTPEMNILLVVIKWVLNFLLCTSDRATVLYWCPLRSLRFEEYCQELRPACEQGKCLANRADQCTVFWAVLYSTLCRLALLSRVLSVSVIRCHSWS